MKLNLMAGDDYRDGWVNVDLRGDCKTDLRCDATELPVLDGEADEVMVLDGLEHFPAARTEQVLAEWNRVLRPGGVLTVKVPNMAWLARALAAYDDLGKLDACTALIRNIMGGHRWGPDGAWDAHHNNWTPVLLHEELDKAGFDVQSNDCEPNMRVTAVKR